MIYLRDEGGLVRQGFNVYPSSSNNVGFLLAAGRRRFMLRYSKITGWFDCCGWREAASDAAFDL